VNNTHRAGIVFSLLALIGGCKGRSPTAAPAAPGAVAPPPGAAAASGTGTLTPAEIKWGASVVPTSKVTYQDDVVVLAHGADAVRAMATNGLTWTLDANAPGADRIQVDKIVFATGRVVGRVLAMERTGNDLSVTLGPVEITEVIKECDISVDQPLDLSKMVSYPAPDYPGAGVDLQPVTVSSTGRESGRDVAYVAVISRSGEIASGISGQPDPQWTTRDRSRFRSMQASFAGYRVMSPASASFGTGDEARQRITGFNAWPYYDGGLGVKFVHNGSDAKITAYAMLYLTDPSMHFELKITPRGGLQTAVAVLKGGAGFTVHFEAGTATGMTGKIDESFFVPTDLRFAITGLGTPFSAAFRQTLNVHTDFTAQNATLSATGDYKFTGEISAGYRNGSWTVSAPTQFTATKSTMLQSIEGVSLGVNGLTFGYGGKLMIGIGGYGFITGPYAGFNTEIGITKGSTMTVAMSVPCRGAILDVSLRYGVGYQFPQFLADAINVLFGLVNIKPIKSSGGPEGVKQLFYGNDVFPAGCQGPPPAR
jgi:hypothetical protein